MITFLQFITEEKNIGHITDKNGNKYKVTHENIYPQTYWVHHQNEKIGKATMYYNGSTISNVIIDKKHQRKGLATSLYNKIEQHRNIKLEPSDSLNKASKALWKSRNK